MIVTAFASHKDAEQWFVHRLQTRAVASLVIEAKGGSSPALDLIWGPHRPPLWAGSRLSSRFTDPWVGRCNRWQTSNEEIGYIASSGACRRMRLQMMPPRLLTAALPYRSA